MSNADVAARDGKHYKGYKVRDIHHFLEDIPTIDHIGETVAFLTAKKIPSIVCTLAWTFVAEFFAKKYGFIGWSGPTLFADQNGAFTGKVLSNFHETDKPSFVEGYCCLKNVRMSDVFHVGDSRSDIPLFNAVGFSVAFNGDDSANSAALASIESDSLLDILPLIPGLKSKQPPL
jgi:phosphoserine phosphatase